MEDKEPSSPVFKFASSTLTPKRREGSSPVPDGEFKPWDVNELCAKRASKKGLLSMLVVVIAGNPAMGAIGMAVAIIALLFAWGFFQTWWSERGIALSRRYGIKVEKEANQRAQEFLSAKGVQYQTNLKIRGVGDLDGLALMNGTQFPIEIKSYQYWRNGGEREEKTIHQSARQCRAMRAGHGIIWLPKATNSWWQLLLGIRDRQLLADARLGQRQHVKISVVIGGEGALFRRLDILSR